MKEYQETHSTLSEPSGYTVSKDDHVTFNFSDVKEIYASDMHFISKGVRYGRIWIIKGLTERYRENEVCLEMLKKEFQILMRLKHENIVQGVSFEEVAGLGKCIIMEFIDGQMLGEWLKENPTLEDRYRVAKEIIDALSHTHRQGIVHRDVKLENIIITRISHRPKLIDFGLADADDYAVFKHPAGTEGYVSPEQKRTSTPDVRNDIFSFGKVLEKLLPEKRFRHTRRDCTRSIDKRPADFTRVKKLLRHDRYLVGRMTGYTIVFTIILAIGAVFINYPNDVAPNVAENEITEETTIPSTNAPETEDIRKDPVGVSYTSPSLDSPKAMNETSQENGLNKIQKARQKVTATLEDFIKEGVAQIDQLWNNSAMKYLDTLTSMSNIPLDWSTAQMERVRDSMISSHKSDLSEEDLQSLKKQLNTRIEENYAKWNKRRLEMNVMPDVTRN